MSNTAVYADTETDTGEDVDVKVEKDVGTSDTGEVVNSGDKGDIRGELDSNNLEITGSGEEFTAKIIEEKKIEDGEPGNQPIVTLGDEGDEGEGQQKQECKHDFTGATEQFVPAGNGQHNICKECTKCHELIVQSTVACTMAEEGREHKAIDKNDVQHMVVGKCSVCNQPLELMENCVYETVTPGHSNQECKKCGNYRDANKKTPIIDVSFVKASDGTEINPEHIQNGNDNYYTFNEAIKLIVKVQCDAMNDEAESDFLANMNVDLYLYGENGEIIVALNKKGENISFDAESHTATYEYTTPESLKMPLTIYKVKADYSMYEKSNGIFSINGRHRWKEKSGSATAKINYVVCNVNSQEHFDKLKDLKIKGGDWEYDESKNQIWYSKAIHEADLTVTLNGDLGARITEPSLVESAGPNKGTEYKGKEPKIKPIWRDFFFLSFYNELEFEIPADIDDGEHVFTLKAVINNQSVEYKDAIHIFIDNTVPEIEDIKYNSDATKINDKYYNKDVEIQVVASDEQAFDYVASKLSVTGHEGEVTFKPNEEDKALASVLITEETSHELSGKIFDQAGNSVEIEKQPEFIIDKTCPELKVNFDNHDAKHDKYYKADRKATFVFTDLNIDGNEAKMANVAYTAAEGTPTIGEMSGENGSYTGTMLFDKDGVYKLGAIESYKFVDKAGNPVKLKEGSDSDYSAEFVIDKTAPTISISFDNNSYQNEMYYKDARTAEITFTEKNFAKEQVTINKNSSDLDNVPSLSGYTDSDSKHIARIVFDKDGRYGFTVGCEDLAGNLANTVASNNFVIDRTVPELEITGVTHMSANNGAVVPVITSKDLNINEYSTEIQLTGSNNGTMHPTIDKKLGTGNCVYTISDLAHEKSNDDLYKLSVKLKDFAGNEVTKEVTYSINRFGSVFVLGDATKAMVDGYYVTNPQNVVITEINVDSLTKKDVSLAWDGDVKNLREGSDYQSSDVTNERGWHSISYNVPSANFRKDGLYAVTIFSEDRASNRQSNQSKDAEVNFLVDQTAPSVIVSGIEDGGVYEEESHDFSVNVTDTIGVTGMTVYLNGEKLASYTQSELNENGGTAVLTMPSKDDYQNVTIECSDVAGNKANLAFNNILVSVKAEELLVEKEVEQSAGIPGLTSAGDAIAAAIDMKKVVPVVIVIAAIAVFAGAGVIVVNRKRNK
jgi:hypothetical protein